MGGRKGGIGWRYGKEVREERGGKVKERGDGGVGGRNGR